MSLGEDWDARRTPLFLGLSEGILEPYCQFPSAIHLGLHGARKRATPKVKAVWLVRTLVFHLVRGTGTLSENLWLLYGQRLSASSMSERRQNLPWKVFAAIMEEALGPKAQEKKHRRELFTRVGDWWPSTAPSFR